MAQQALYDIKRNAVVHDDDSVEGKPNHRSGYSKKSVLTGTSKMTLSVP
jgi:hypothetical protein